MRGEVPGLQSPYKSTHFRHRPISGAKNEPQLNASMSSLAGRILKSLSTKSRMVKAIPTKRFTHSAVQALIEKDNLVVKASDHVDQYPLVWLRDNCTCEKCYHKDSQSRIINWNDFNIDVNIKSIKTNGDNKIEIDWDDDHRSIYNFDWLKKRSFKRTVQEKYLADSYLPEKILWDKKDFFNVIKTYQYDDVMNDDESHYNWLRDLAVYGVSLIENAPPNPGECRKLSEKVAFIRKTHYG
ncbi:PREDICTED: gamma-butyrobetaine dioxygenase-like [Nicrophorus vespilloides]|uniref:Gamma-butyrobetaine dioxygenase-like n=1 Tax=Nicrophorus vespilloides TaxID=110193 RepID=A0ABM1MYF1_NICVS|nr:PREDICTED: gamma-butyrobetaine dioxygenase-like [Nicrophorus vespilloides]